MAVDSRAPYDRLSEALDLFERFTAEHPDGDPASLLEVRPDLADLIAPLLEDADRRTREVPRDGR